MNTANKTNLFGLDRDALGEFLEAQGEKRFRAQQLMKWIYHEGVTDFDQMTNLGKALRAKLADIAEVSTPSVITSQHSKDGTRKWVLKMDDDNAIETVFIPDGDRATLCISSQVGCTLDCTFCSTAQQGFNRNLSTAEIIGQVWYAKFALLKERGQDAKQAAQQMSQGLQKRTVTNVVLMGMGEPLANYSNVLPAMKLMLDDFGFGLSKRRVTLSTSGIVPKLRQLKEDVDVALAVSLHAPNDQLRDQIVPINRKYPISVLMGACKEYVADKAGRTKITWEYVMLDGVNDSDAHARELARLLADVPSKVNLIPFNPFPETQFKRSPSKRIESFAHVLLKKGISVTRRRTRGEDIDAACGQLAGKVSDKVKRQERMAKHNDVIATSPLMPMKVRNAKKEAQPAAESGKAGN